MAGFDLVAFDLDGTVFRVPFKQEVSERVQRAFGAAHEAGVTIAVASGRPNWMLGKQLLGARWLDWRICANGTRIIPSRGDDEGLSLPIARADAFWLLDYLAGLGGCFTLHTNTQSLLEQAKVRFLAEENALKSKGAPGSSAGGGAPLNPIDIALKAGGMTLIDSVVGELNADPTIEAYKLDCHLPNGAATEEALAKLARDERFEVAKLGPCELEIARTGASKGAGVGWLCQHLGIDENRAVAFGDSGNDLSMTGRALTFVAMGNATPEIKAAADDITDDVFHDGVATWIEAHL